jgi:orotate phosphoribosyltransferase
MDTLDTKALIKMFKEDGAILEGHFLLTSGFHSSMYVQCARVLSHPDKAEMLGRALAAAAEKHNIQAVVSPAIGGIVIGQETARGLGVRSIFAERAEGSMTLRRGFEVSEGERFLVVEDVMTTGGSLKEVMALIESRGGVAAAAGTILLRSKNIELGVPLISLLEMEIKAHPPENCPLCLSGAPPPVKPGSRGNY